MGNDMSNFTDFISSGGGGGGSNTNPKTLPAVFVRNDRLSRPSSGSGRYLSSQSYFWAPNLLTATYSSFTANTSKTIVDISNASGYLTNIVCPSPPNETSYTYLVKVTIDGTATSLFYDNSNWSYMYGADNRLVLGYTNFIGDQYSGTVSNYGNTAMPADLASATDPAWNTDHNWIAQYQYRYRSLPNPDELKSIHPDACIRFESSLKVEITTSFNQSGSQNQNAGVLYVLDTPAS